MPVKRCADQPSYLGAFLGETAILCVHSNFQVFVVVEVGFEHQVMGLLLSLKEIRRMHSSRAQLRP